MNTITESAQKKIRHPQLALVEGSDDINFFIELGKHLGITTCSAEPVESVSKFRHEIPGQINRPGFEKVTHLAIIRDKDSGSIEDAFKSIHNIFKSRTQITNLPSQHGQWSDGYPKIGIFIMPGGQKGTMLEDLCLSAVANQLVMECVDEFSDCIAGQQDSSTNLAKTKTLAYLSAQKEPVNTIGLGAQKGYWNFNAPELDELKEFLLELKDN